MPEGPEGTPYVTDVPPHVSDALTVSQVYTVERAIVRRDEEFVGQSGTLLGFIPPPSPFTEYALLDDNGSEICVTAESLLVE